RLALRLPRPPTSPALFPSTTLFRSSRRQHGARGLLARARRAPGSRARRAQWIALGSSSRVSRARSGAHRGLLRLKKLAEPHARTDRKSTRLNSSHVKISYAVLCLKK